MSDWRWRPRRPPNITSSFVDSNEIAATNLDFVASLEEFSLSHGAAEAYKEKFFHISPLYGEALTGLDSLIMLDSTDLEFLADPQILEEEMAVLKKQGKVLALGRDLAPFYFIYTAKYRAYNPKSTVGQAGSKQGLNTAQSGKAVDFY